MSGEKLWGGRFEGALDPAFEAFNASLRFDRRLLFAELRQSTAWARALARAGVLTQVEAERIATALEKLGRELAADATPLDRSEAEDIHSFVEAALVREGGELGRRLHTGRSRNDQVATDLKLYLREELAHLDRALHDLCAALVALAEATADLALPGYTHLQRAQPITAGHHALAYVEMLARDADRLGDAKARMETCPLGSGALAGCPWPIDREILARELGFARPTANSLDGVSDRDHVIEVLSAASLILIHLSRLAEDWIFLASQEAGLITLGDDVSTGSSLMPHKKNPDALELIRGKCGRVIGNLTGFLATSKALPLAYDKDLQEDKEALFDTLDTTRACLGVMTTVTGGVSYDRERCRAAAERGFLDATDLADLLVKAGLPFRDAHERVGAAVRAALEAGCELRDLAPELRASLLGELEVDPRQALTLATILERRSTIGGTAPAEVARQVAAWKERLEAWPKS